MRSAPVWICLSLPGLLGFARAQGPVAPASPTPAPSAAVTGTPTPSIPPRRLTSDELRSREREVILALQTIMQAERTYAASNGGLFDTIACLSEPWKCVPAYPADGASFLDPTYDWLATRQDYARGFHPGPQATPDELRRLNASPSSLKSWAFTATPLHPGVTGSLGLCCDSKGRICFTDDGSAPAVKDGLCEPCKKLR